MKKSMILALCISAIVLTSAIPVLAASNIISVNGTGIVTLTPDLVRLSIGITTEEQDVNSAITKNSTVVNAIRQTVLDLGIAADDIRTENYSMYSSSNIYRGDGYDPAGYTYSIYYTYNITIRDTAQLNAVIDACIVAGANNINSVEFDSSKRDEAYQKATNYAIDDAQAKAERTAEKIGVDLSGIEKLVVLDQALNFYDLNRSAANETMDKNMGGGGGSPDISSGQLKISVSVTADYAFSPK